MPEINGWETRARVFFVDHASGHRPTLADSTYTIWLSLSKLIDQNSQVDSIYRKSLFKVKKATIQFVENGKEKQLVARFAGENWNSEGRWEKRFDFGQVAIPHQIQKIQLNFTVSVEGPEPDDEVTGKELAVKMHRLEEANWGLWLPGR